MVGIILIAIIFLMLCYCLVALYRNELVVKYRLRYLAEFGPFKYEADMPTYDHMLYAHMEWSILRLRRYVIRGEL